MNYPHPGLHRGKYIRLAGHHSIREAKHCITLTTMKREHLFGQFTNGEMILNDFGKIIEQAWQWIGTQYNRVEVDRFVMMPNHLHGVLLYGSGEGGVSRNIPSSKPLGRITGAFKTASTKRINEKRRTPGAKLWQKEFWDHIIRNRADLERIRDYTRDNPREWQQKIDS